MPARPSPLYRDHLFLVGVLWAVFLMMLAVMHYANVFSAPYFSFGPNPTLKFLGVPIDTVEKYCAVVAVRIVCVAVQTLVGTVVGPWITTVFANSAIPVVDMGYTVPKSTLIVMFYETVGILLGLISFLIVFTQLDLALIEGVVTLVVIYAWTIPEWIRAKYIAAANRAEGIELK